MSHVQKVLEPFDATEDLERVLDLIEGSVTVEEVELAASTVRALALFLFLRSSVVLEVGLPGYITCYL